ncbi:GNAT family N-acetyltransferase [Longimicrobium terrae]|uniref:RimJ/RimL family protein N-acetyltransferase n=1 Tax=Longimicrobium terrae TaxID=1639882 RepID=A0A841GWX7_9BACT|nr:GNAT family N-acetyltransferase [Longimicrobium terrae]MBB4634074.1 RimJ/RimL family protein N-acetyltransferase [Longimicrobium terrae]MBB6069036.1 RimJ/RimL family protein N-acetyltransferase [Longimicrobium terrae]NNC28212.1 GNAT family N-acetyltransferase [Longimicrobium terrae]
MIPPERFTTGRLIIRRAQPSDAGAMFERWAQDPDVTRYLSWTPHRRVEDTEAYLAFCTRQWEARREFVWMLQAAESDTLIGSISARPGDHGINLGYLLTRDAWGGGLMTEAATAVTEWWLAQEGVFRVWATCHPGNAASARVLEKSGFQFEGRLRRWEEYPNAGAEPMDSLSFSRTVREPSAPDNRP